MLAPGPGVGRSMASGRVNHRNGRQGAGHCATGFAPWSSPGASSASCASQGSGQRVHRAHAHTILFARVSSWVAHKAHASAVPIMWSDNSARMTASGKKHYADVCATRLTSSLLPVWAVWDGCSALQHTHAAHVAQVQGVEGHRGYEVQIAGPNLSTKTKRWGGGGPDVQFVCAHGRGSGQEKGGKGRLGEEH